MKRPTKQISKLGNALNNLSSILKSDGSILEQHVLLKNNWVIANNGIIGIGEPIQEDLNCAPNGWLLKEALAKCGSEFSIAQLAHTLEIKAGKFKAIIPCIPPEDLQSSFPDPAIAPVTNAFKISLDAVSALALDENSVVTASVLIDGGTITATDRKVIIQHWMGLDLPPQLALPKALIKPLLSNSKNLQAFGFSNSSCTFHFEDGAWLKTQYFAEKWPDINSILNKRTNQHPLPEDFYPAVEALASFSEDGFIYCSSNIMRSHEAEGKGASYEVYGLPTGPVLNIKQLKMLKPFIKTIDFLVPHFNYTMSIWHGENVRGAIAGRV